MADLAARETTDAGARAARRMTSRTPVGRILPPSVVAALRAAVDAADDITPELVEDVDLRFDIQTRHGVTRRRLRNYLRRLHRSNKCKTDTDKCDAADVTGEEWREKLGAHRRRQASVASILDATFGPMATCGPDLWDRRAYLMLVGLVYERLALSEEELPTAELVALAKVLAEGRRVDLKLRERADAPVSGEPRATSGGALPERFADIVRNVYGADFHAPDEARRNGRFDDRETREPGSDGAGG